MQLCIGKTDEHTLDRFISDWSLCTNFVEGFDDQFTCFVESLNTLGIVDENVCSIDSVDLSHQVLVHAKFTEFVSGLLCIACSDWSITEVAIS